MKVVLTVRTLNEQYHIDRFCQSFSWVDKILVADGGSTDDTVSMALQYSNVEVREFSQKKKMKNGYWRNPEAEHINFLTEWAESLNPDWIIFDDADEYANVCLQNHARELLSNADLLGVDYVRIIKVYIYMQVRYFRNMNYFYDNWQPVLWAWKPKAKVRAVNSDMAFEFPSLPKERIGFYDVYPPDVILHNAWPTGQLLKRKMDFYRRSGQISEMKHPTDFGGPMSPLEDWMVS